MYANKIGLYMYTSDDENAGFAQQKSTTDPVKCSAHMNYACFKVFRRNAFISYMCLSKVSSFLFLHQINISCAFVDVNIFCRCANYLLQLQNIRKVDMIVCMYNCFKLYILLQLLRVSWCFCVTIFLFTIVFMGRSRSSHWLDLTHVFVLVLVLGRNPYLLINVDWTWFTAVYHSTGHVRGCIFMVLSHLE